MGCCCSSCKVPDIERSLTPEELTERHQKPSQSISTPQVPQQPQIPKPPQQARSPQPVPAAPTTIPDDQPPPYESNDRSSVFGSRDTLDQEVVPASTSSQAVKDLPYVIPLTSTGSAKAEDSLAAAYAPDLQSLGVPESRYLAFLAGLDQGLFASPSAEPGSASAYIQSMFRDQDGTSDVTWRTNTSSASMGQSQTYLQTANTDLFHKAALHVEVLKTGEMKARIDAASHAELVRAQGTSALDKIEGKRSQEALKLEQRLLTSKTLDKQQKAMRKYLEKDAKYNYKALKAINKAEERIESKQKESGNDDGVFWLLVTRYAGQN